jgi:excisionase family DNA binding protein
MIPVTLNRVREQPAGADRAELVGIADEDKLRVRPHNLSENAKLLGVGERYVRRMVAERRVPTVKIGHYVRFDLADIRKCGGAPPAGCFVDSPMYNVVYEQDEHLSRRGASASP